MSVSGAMTGYSRGSYLSVAVLFGALCFPHAVLAQQASGIAGQVKDTSGAVLPGVTVEAASPALIEKVRSVVTDAGGQYNIVGLGPGAYSVTFSLPGFRTLKREGIVLTAGFTATVSGDLQVGSVEESVTVTGAAPLVDTSNVRQTRVISNELLSALPSGNKALQTLVTVVPGMTGAADVGGASGVYRTNVPRLNTFHGKTSAKQTYDSMNVMNLGAAGATAYVMNPSTAVETTVETGGVSAESSASGLMINLVPKEGGNTFSGEVSGIYTNEHFQSNNLTDALRAQGLSEPNKAYYVYDVNPSFGGPLSANRLWFFTAPRFAGNRNSVPGVYFNKTQGTPFYTPDFDKPSYRSDRMRSIAGRLTWQASAKNKINGFADIQSLPLIGRGDFVAQEAQQGFLFWPNTLTQGTWSSPRTSKLLLEAGASWMHTQFPANRFPSVKDDDISILESRTGFRYNARGGYGNEIDDRVVERFSASYVTGSHAYKAGVQVEEGYQSVLTRQNVATQLSYTFLDGIPSTITEGAGPFWVHSSMVPNVMLFAQDQWIAKRLTLNYGVRFDYLRGSVPAEHVDPTPFVPFERNFQPTSNLPNWKDVNPRLGVAYDLFGNGRTALKTSIGRYVGMTGVNIAVQNNPLNTSVNSVTRTWRDDNKDYVPNCVLTNPAQNGECGAISNSNFGLPNPLVTRWADDVLHGWFKRDYLWDFTVEVQHEIRRGISVTGGYYRNWSRLFQLNASGNDQFVTDNLLVTPGDFSPYCITAPKDPRLPAGGGYQVCGLYDVAPSLFGKVQNLVAQPSNYGKQKYVNDFFGLSVNTRFSSGLTLGGGADTGRTTRDTCFVVDSPQSLLYCHNVTPWLAQTQVKMFGSYPLTAGFAVSATFQNLAGANYTANYTATNAEIKPTLGRNLAACGAQIVCNSNAVVPLVAPNTLYQPRRTQVDVRLSKRIRLSAKSQLEGNLDVYNLFNSSAALNLNSTYGSRWQFPVGASSTGPEALLWGRMVQFGGRITF